MQPGLAEVQFGVSVQAALEEADGQLFGGFFEELVGQAAGGEFGGL